MAEIKTNQINVFVFGRNQTAIPGAKVVAYDGEEGIGGAIMGRSAVSPARITLSEEYKSVKLIAFVEGHGSKEATVNAEVGNYYFEFEDVGQSEESTRAIGGSMGTQTRASWIFGSLFVAFLLGVFMFGPATLPDYKQRILAYVCALLAGLFALFFTGSLLLNAELPIGGKWAVQGGAGFALFLIVLFWWSGALAPVKPAKIDPIVPTKPVTQIKGASIPPLVRGGAPVGTEFQYTYTRNDGSLECVSEYVKVSATEWYERPSSNDPSGCLADAANFRYTERESDDEHFILLYDEGRSLLARLSNSERGQSGPTAWRLISDQAWNAARSLTRVN